MSTKFRGIFPPVPSIVDEQGELDKAGMARMLDHVIESGADGMLILGSGGEFSQFSSLQRKEIAAFCLHHVDSRVPVLVGRGTGRPAVYAHQPESRVDRSRAAVAGRGAAYDGSG